MAKVHQPASQTLLPPLGGHRQGARSAGAAGSEHEHLERLARLMDDQFEIPGLGWRFGFDSLIGLIPGLGDTLTGLVSLYILATASKFGLPKITLARMGVNVAIDYTLGSIPLVGDAFDVWFKCNRRNMRILQRSLDATPVASRRARRGDQMFVVGIIIALVLLAVGAALVAFLILRFLAEQLGGLF